MLSLDSPRWKELSHLYGDADDVPEMLSRLARAEADEQFQSIMQELMSAVYHQHDSCSAAHAVTPHLANLCRTSSLRRCRHLIHSIARIEEARQTHQRWGTGTSTIPEDIAPAYYATLQTLPWLIADCFVADWDVETSFVMAEALLVAKGHADYGMQLNQFVFRLSVFCPKCGKLVWIRQSEEQPRSQPCPACGAAVRIA